METPSPTLSPPPWEVLVLVAHHLEPKTLAIASCVSKSWSSSMSSDHLWKPILAIHFPSLSTLPPPAVPYSRLFAIAHSAAKRRCQNPSKPNLLLSDLAFAISISTHNSHVIFTTTKTCDMLLVDPPGVFRFGVGCDGMAVSEGLEEVKIAWNVILKGWRGVFTMMDCKGKVGLLPGGEGWFSQELPAPGCCSNAVASAVVADLKLGMCGCKGSDDGKVKVNKVNVGILSVVDWRYVGVEDGLRYLQHFLLTYNGL
ncbi:probable F-box protein At5g04010 [Gastrolobium bilobum]|uniref:probable F-box protein At5g04010 n=1 Tax=Gastrolobium bilobum TaxID=150636 RepID=UPI002AB32075|nr:probable F-box protein At5g04010 [Gastrolobium bilobum]